MPTDIEALRENLVVVKGHFDFETYKQSLDIILDSIPSLLDELERLRKAVGELKEMDVFCSPVQAGTNGMYPLELCQEWRSKRDMICKKFNV